MSSEGNLSSALLLIPGLGVAVLARIVFFFARWNQGGLARKRAAKVLDLQARGTLDRTR